MSRTTLGLLFIVVLAGVAPGDLVVNGDFEQPLDVGWNDTINSLAGSFSFDRWDSLGQPVPGYAARVYKLLASYASLYQVIDVPGANLLLNFDGRFRIGGGSSTCWPVASFWVRYLDAAGTELGNTRLYLHDQYATWARSETVSLIEVEENGVWRNYSLNVAQELASNLPGINAADVRRVRLDLFAYDNGT